MNIRSTLLASLILLASTPTHAQFWGRVERVVDGDTIEVFRDREHLQVRVAGIDAPESSQSFSEQSAVNLKRLMADKLAYFDCQERHEQAGRVVCGVVVDGTDVALEQIRAGMAWWSRINARSQAPHARLAYETAEMFAKARKRGLWSDVIPVPPWLWRKDLRAGK